MDEYEIRSYLLNLLKTTPQLIKLIFQTNYAHLTQRRLYHELKYYLDEFIKKPNQKKFFVIPGLRGVGKSTILYQLYDYLINTLEISSNQVLLLDLENLKYEKNLNILDYINVFIKDINEKYYLTETPLFIFVDESQYDKKWDSVGKLVYDNHVNVFMIFTGSNALNLSYSADAARRLKKKPLYPLNFIEYLEIKHGIKLPDNLNETIYSLLLTGNIDKAIKIEKEIQLKISQGISTNINLEWEKYIQYGNLPFGLNDKPLEVVQETLDMTDRIIEKDFILHNPIKQKTKQACFPLIKQLAMRKPGKINYTSISDMLDIDSKTVKNIIKNLEKTELIFPVDAYGSPANREKSSFECYFLATQIKAAYFLNNGDVSNNYREYMGLLLENLVATSLYKLRMYRKDGFNLYYDSRKGGVDFIIKSFDKKAVPIEVGIGKKNKKQISNAMKKYKSTHGIIVSNKTDHIVKDKNIIFIPTQTFSLI